MAICLAAILPTVTVGYLHCLAIVYTRQRMKAYQLHDMGQMIHHSGDAFLSVLLDDLGCGHAVGTIDRLGNIYIPPIPGDGRVHLVAMSTPTHAFAIVIDTQAMEATIMDSSHHEISSIGIPLMDYLRGMGYTYKLHGCPARRLPQQQDKLCTLWSRYMIYEACKGRKPRELIMSVEIVGMYRFARQAIDMLIGSGLYAKMLRLYTITTAMTVAGMRVNMPAILERYRNTHDKGAYMDTLPGSALVKGTYVDSRFTSMVIRGMALGLKYRKLQPTVLKDIYTIGNAISAIRNAYPDPISRELLLEALVFAMTGYKSSMTKEQLLKHMIYNYSPEQRILIDTYVLPHMDILLGMGNRHKVLPKDYPTTYRWIRALAKATDIGNAISDTHT